jgi:hypothetical protein
MVENRRVFAAQEWGVDSGTYRARIDTFRVSSVKKTAATQEVMEGNQCLFVGLVIMVSLVVESVELNPGPTVEEEKLDQILTHVRNQEERESKVIKKLLEMHNHESGEIKNGNKELVVKFEKLSEAINNVMAEYKQIEHAVKKWEEKQHMVADKLLRVEELQRKNNIFIFGLEEEENENYFDTTEAVANSFKDTMRER